MTGDQFADAMAAASATLVTALRAELPNETEVIDRFIFEGVDSEETWIAALQDENNVIRKCIVLLPQMDLQIPQLTRMGAGLKPLNTISIELYHDYKFGTDSVNTETEFRRDAAKIIYTLGKHRTLGNQSVITQASLRLGLRPSRVQTLHQGKGQASLDFSTLQYT